MDNILFANQVLAGLSNPARGLVAFCTKRRAGNRDSNSNAEMARRKNMRDIADAQKFYVDRQLVKTAIELSFSKPKEFIELAQRAKPCFNNLWLEWDEEYRVDCLKEEVLKTLDPKYHDTIDPANNKMEKVGYHIQELNGKPFYTMYGADRKFENNKIFISRTGFYFSNDEPILSDEFKESTDYYTNNPTWLAEDKYKIIGMMMGRSYVAHYFNSLGLFEEYVSKTLYDRVTKIPNELLTSRDNLQLKKVMDWCLDRFETGQSIGQEMFLTDKQFATGYDFHEMSRVVEAETTAMDGDLRFLVCVLGLLNYDHIKYNNAKTSPKIRYLRYGVQAPKHSYKLITIDLPHNIRKVYKGITTGMGSPKAEHMRRGHWRVTKYKDGTTKRIWIKPMKVGNKEFGTIEHDYILRGRKKDVDISKLT